MDAANLPWNSKPAVVVPEEALHGEEAEEDDDEDVDNDSGSLALDSLVCKLGSHGP
jgi:hypothetical protein